MAGFTGRTSSLIKYNDRSLKDLTTTPAAAGGDTGAVVHIKTITASADATISFVNGASSVVLDSTYPIYKIEFINIHPATAGSILKVNFSDDTSSHSYDLTKTTTSFYARLDEDDSDGQVTYNTNNDLAQSTADQEIILNTNNNNDSSCSGELTLFNPSSTTFVKHFLVSANSDGESSRCFTTYISGYVNTTAAVTAVRFNYGSDNIDAGTFKLYGIKDA